MGLRKKWAVLGIPQVFRIWSFKHEKPPGIKGRTEEAVNCGRKIPSPGIFTTARSPYYPALLSVYE
jgi:hypothetical protein